MAKLPSYMKMVKGPSFDKETKKVYITVAFRKWHPAFWWLFIKAAWRVTFMKEIKGAE